MTSRELHWRTGDRDVSCRIEESGGQGSFYISGTSLPFRVLGPAFIEIDGKRHRYYVTRSRDDVIVWLDGHTFRLRRAVGTHSDTASDSRAKSAEVRALMPGKLMRLAVAVGDVVQEKQPVATMESMKMESALLAPKSGRVVEIGFKPGDALDMGEILMRIEDTDSA